MWRRRLSPRVHEPHHGRLSETARWTSSHEGCSVILVQWKENDMAQDDDRMQEENRRREEERLLREREREEERIRRDEEDRRRR